MTPLLGFCGASNSGKTTLACAVLTELTRRGLKVGALKHHGHGEPLAPVPGASQGGGPKDSDRLLAAGARRVALAHAGGLTLWAGGETALQCPEELVGLFMGGLDLALVEGYKGADLDKIEVVAPGKDPILPPGGRLLAITRRGGSGREAGLPVLDADQPAQVADFVLDHLKLASVPAWRLSLDGREVEPNPALRNLLQDALRALRAGLPGGELARRLEIRFD